MPTLLASSSSAIPTANWLAIISPMGASERSPTGLLGWRPPIVAMYPVQTLERVEIEMLDGESVLQAGRLSNWFGIS